MLQSSILPFSAYLPISHGVQSIADVNPVFVDDLPAGQTLHLSLESNPVAELYVFAEQFLCLD